MVTEGRWELIGVCFDWRENRDKIEEEWVYKEVPKLHKGYCYQLKGRYRFRNTRTGEFASVTGYSKEIKRKRRGRELQTLREQAIDHAKAKLVDIFGERKWLIYAIEHEVWLKW